MDCVIGIDIGTTSTIGILIALPDQVLATASRPATLSSPHPGWAEEDPALWWDNTCALIEVHPSAWLFHRCTLRDPLTFSRCTKGASVTLQQKKTGTPDGRPG